MDLLWQIGLSNAVVATLLAACVFITSRFVKRPALVHGLWLLVFLKLITPPLWNVPTDWLLIPGVRASLETGSSALALAVEAPASPTTAAVTPNVDPMAEIVEAEVELA